MLRELRWVLSRMEGQVEECGSFGTAHDAGQETNIEHAANLRTTVHGRGGKDGATYPALVSTSGWMTVLAIVLAVRRRGPQRPFVAN